MRSEADTRANFIDPALKKSRWRFEYIQREAHIKYLDGPTLKNGYADYLLVHKNTPLAIIEAKRLAKPCNTGLQKAIKYASIISVRLYMQVMEKRSMNMICTLEKGSLLKASPAQNS